MITMVVFSLLKVEFDSEVVKNKWDIMKIICWQPFSRNVQLGLSFVGVKPVEAPISEVRHAPKSTPKSVEDILDHFFGQMPSRLGSTAPITPCRRYKRFNY